MSLILTLNAGSSSIKFALYEKTLKGDPPLIVRGKVERIGTAARLVVNDSDGKRMIDISASNHREALNAILEELKDDTKGRTVAGVGHRIVHGGPDFSAPVRISEANLEAIRALSPLAPLHQPHNVSAIEAALAEFPKAMQVGIFGTAFHAGKPFTQDAYGIPRRYYEAGVRRYGFHGLSYTYIAERLEARYPALYSGRVIVAHLGNGASMCAMKGGQSIATTMGFSALDGLCMGTRPGQLDPGVLLYLLDNEGMTSAEVSKMLYKESGLKGLSENTNDMRVLLESSDVKDKEAVAYFTARIQREIGSLTAALGGLDGIVFTGGIGENSAEIRAGIANGMGWIGLELNEAANEAGGPVIGSGAVQALVIPTNEELVMARAVVERL
ncbi:acetate/propionate family kinase [Alphaproteobacteria bacterium KMM 3653]|uniref:Acetate kinase n=1 Tax=Harenicola maris TaxID=2841044 RepID=A0AAP2CTC3_9RHOB|nr:acetate/propionate family kinase [Harenicola maris]